MPTLTCEHLDQLVAAYAGEWVLIDVLEMDETTTTPTRVDIIEHSTDWEKLALRGRELKRNTMLVYSLKPEEKGIAPVV